MSLHLRVIPLIMISVSSVIILPLAYEYDVNEIRKQSIPAMHLLATEMMKAEQYDVAIDIFSEIIDLDKSDLTAWHWKGIVLLEVGQCHEFFENTVKYLKQFPDNMWAESTFEIAKRCDTFDGPYSSLKELFDRQEKARGGISQ